MMSLVLALHTEGPTDDRFLPIVIQRTAEQVLSQRGRTSVDVLDPIVLRSVIEHRSKTLPERILEAARSADGYHALIVHADADHPTAERAFTERYQPGLKLVEKARDAREPVCKHLLPIIPVQMTEAWMLADAEALRKLIGTSLEAHALGLPGRAPEVEADANPKQTLRQVVQHARAHRRRRRMDIGTLYEPLARQMNLSQLSTVPAYQHFVRDLTDTLIDLRMAE